MLVCQVCAQKAVAFLCVDCQTYQCEVCCAARHLHVEGFAAHLYFCVEGNVVYIPSSLSYTYSCWAILMMVSFVLAGSSSNLIRYAKWSLEFLEMAKMSRRMKLQELNDERVAAAMALAVKQEAANAAAAVTDAPVAPPTEERSDETSNGAPDIKMERAHAAAAAEPIQDMQALSINEQQSEHMPPPEVHQSAKAPNLSQTATPSPFVKLEPVPSAPVAPPVASTEPAVAPQATQVVPETTPVKHEQQPPVPPTTQQQPAASSASSNNSNAVVDLTEDDDEFEASSGLSAGIRNVKREQFSSTSIFGNPHSVPATASRPSDEAVVKRERSAWLAAATVSAGSSAEEASGDANLDDAMEDDLFSLTDEDPIMRTMISEYNRLSEVIFNRAKEIATIQKQIKDLLANQAVDMNEVVQCRNTAAQVKNSVVKDTHSRNAVVARLVVDLKQDSAELKALLDESQATDIPHMQTASHRRCAQFEALVREKRYTIRKLKRSMEDAINMKSQDAFAEVSRLGAMIAADEQAVKESEEDRLVEFVRLFQFSKQIRNAARNMVSSSAP